MAKITSITDVQPSFADIKAWYEQHLHPSVIDFDDPLPYKVYAEARWAGIFQCIDEDTSVLMGDNSHKLIKNVKAGDSVVTFDEANQQFTTSTVDVFYDQGIKECIELVFDNGKRLVCTTDHPLMTKNRGWVKAQHLTDDDELMEVP